jgi:hypothetical protein
VGGLLADLLLGEELLVLQSSVELGHVPFLLVGDYPPFFNLLDCSKIYLNLYKILTNYLE